MMKDVHALHSDELLIVQFKERGQPFGDIQPILSNFMGTIARNGNLFSLSFLNWRKMPKNRLDEAWKLITARFIIPDSHRSIVMQTMGVAWKRWRTEVKAKSYDSNVRLDDLIRIRPIPHELTPEVWETLCHYWKSNERIPKINRENATKKRGIHAQGRTNIPTLEHKFTKENGRNPSRIETLQLIRRSKRVRGLDDEAVRIEVICYQFFKMIKYNLNLLTNLFCWNLLNEAVQRRLQEMLEGTQAIEVHEEAFREIFGPEHSDRIRCLVASALPSQIFPENCKRNIVNKQDYHSNSDVTNKLLEMEEKMKDMEEREKQTEIDCMEEKQQLMMQIQEHQLQNCTSNT